MKKNIILFSLIIIIILFIFLIKGKFNNEIQKEKNYTPVNNIQQNTNIVSSGAVEHSLWSDIE